MRKRKNGQGMIRQRKDGRWEGRIVIGYDEKSLPITKNVLGKTKLECEEKLKVLSETVRKPTEKVSANMPFGEYIDYWYRTFCEPGIAKTTRYKYENEIYLHIIPKIGKIPLASLKKSDLQQFYAQQKRNGNLDRHGRGNTELAGGVIRSIHTRIKCALDQAMREGLIFRNPAVGCTIPPKKSKEVKVLTHEEIQRLMIQAKAEGFYEMILLALATGLRRGELLGLQWEDLNFETGELSVRREYTPLGSRFIISTPKTRTSTRTVRLPESVLEVFAEYRKRVDSEWIFPSPIDPSRPISPCYCRNRLSEMLQRAGCKHIPFHGLRHTFATTALENGLDIKTLSEILGHSSAETTLNVYSHVTAEMERNAAQKIDSAFGTQKPAETAGAEDGQTPDPTPENAVFEPCRGRKRKPGTGCISKVSKNTWQGKYTPMNPDGTRQRYCVYARTREECERKLDDAIQKIKSQPTSI